jgi:hypothetical protein
MEEGAREERESNGQDRKRRRERRREREAKEGVGRDGATLCETLAAHSLERVNGLLLPITHGLLLSNDLLRARAGLLTRISGVLPNEVSMPLLCAAAAADSLLMSAAALLSPVERIFTALISLFLFFSSPENGTRKSEIGLKGEE